MQKAARIGSLITATLFAGSLILGLEFEQWIPIDVAALIASGVFAVGLLAKGQKSGWYYFIVSAALLAGLLTYQRLAFWVVLDIVVIGLNVALFFVMGRQQLVAARAGSSASNGIIDQGTVDSRRPADATGLPNKMPEDSSGGDNSIQVLSEFGTALRASYSQMVADMIQSFRDLSKEAGELKYPSNLDFEVAALLYFAYDFAMSSGDETALRSSIRDEFVAVQRPSASDAAQIADRADEYTLALRSADSARALLRLVLQRLDAFQAPG